MSGRFDGKKKTSITYRLGIGLIFMSVGMIVVFSLLGDDTKSNTMCAEITAMMVDDPEHDRFHNDYPAIMMELHQFLDKNCTTIKDNLGIETNNPDRIRINTGDP